MFSMQSIDKMSYSNEVGPVLHTGSLAQALIAAVKESNHSVRIIKRGAYIRILVPDRCVLTRESIERQVGHSFNLPSDLEKIMPSFKGTLSVYEDEVSWSFERRALRKTQG